MDRLVIEAVHWKGSRLMEGWLVELYGVAVFGEEVDDRLLLCD